MSEGEKAIVQQIAWQVGDAVQGRLEKLLDARMALHLATCNRMQEVQALAEKNAKIIGEFRARAGGFIMAFTFIGGAITALVYFVGHALWQYLRTLLKT